MGKGQVALRPFRYVAFHRGKGGKPCVMAIAKAIVQLRDGEISRVFHETILSGRDAGRLARFQRHGIDPDATDPLHA